MLLVTESRTSDKYFVHLTRAGTTFYEKVRILLHETGKIPAIRRILSIPREFRKEYFSSGTSGMY